jgi:hypothetical protein
MRDYLVSAQSPSTALIASCTRWLPDPKLRKSLGETINQLPSIVKMLANAATASQLAGSFISTAVIRSRDRRLRASQVVSRRDLALEPRWLVSLWHFSLRRRASAKLRPSPAKVL